MTQPKRVVIDMDDKRRELYKKVASQIIDVTKQLETPAEAHAVLQLCLRSLEQTYGIVASEMLNNETDVVQ